MKIFSGELHWHVRMWRSRPREMTAYALKRLYDVLIGERILAAEVTELKAQMARARREALLEGAARGHVYIRPPKPGESKMARELRERRNAELAALADGLVRSA